MNHKQRIRDYYLSQCMDQHRLEILRIAAQKKPGRRRMFFAAIAAALLLMFGFAASEHLPRQNKAIDYVLAEVALNHNKHLAVEVATADIAVLRNALPKLDFSLKLPESLRNNGFTLIGGRYCSLHGQIAAQLKLQQAGLAEPATLYVTRPIPTLKASHATHEIDGIKVRLWTEQGLLYALATER